MRLQGRDLKRNMRGEDVKLLQEELGKAWFFHNSTLKVFLVKRPSKPLGDSNKHGIDPITSVVDEETARVINGAIDALGRDRYLVKGKVVHVDGRPVARTRSLLLENVLRNQHTRRGPARPPRTVRNTIPTTKTKPPQRFGCVYYLNGQEIAVSHLICNVKPVEEVTLVVGRKRCAVRRNMSNWVSSAAALAAEQLDPADLNQEDVNFEADTLIRNPEHVALFVVSARHHRETDIVAEGFYGLRLASVFS